ncbi:MAG: beta-lactamase family protein [Proteobacteria bacterium]|nr:beta-lactamase family protein [Pseudomonadota bacterium]
MVHRRTRDTLATIVATVSLCWGSSGLASDAVAGLAGELEARSVAAYGSGTYPGLVVAAYRGGHPILRQGWGYADLEHRTPMAPETVMYVGSITKPFTGLAIHQLLRHGKLSLDDTVVKLLPDFQGPAGAVTVAQLLTHTGGVPEYVVGPVAQDFRPYGREDVLALFAAKPLDFKPGTAWRYTNSGTYLLGLIIEKVSGKSYADHVATEIAEPLGLKSTSFADESRLVPGRARGYLPSPAGFRNAARYDPVLPFSAGALLSTADDLQVFARMAYGSSTGGSIGPEVRSQLLAPVQLTDGTQPFYRLGSVAVVDFHGRTKVAHAGLTSGFTSFLTHYPDDDVTIVVLSNGSGVTPHPAHLEAELARLILGIPAPAVLDLPLDAEMAKDFAGDFSIAPVHFYGTPGFGFVVRDGRLHFQFGAADPAAPAIPLQFQGDDTFVSAMDSEHIFRFTRKEDVVAGLELSFYNQSFQGTRERAK